jgi:hypothetical protein
MGMKSGAIFLGGLLVMFIFNVFYVVMQPEALWDLTAGAITGFIASILAIGVISGINILGSGLSGTSVRLLFGISSLLTMMFSIPIAGFPLGMGMANNMINTFSESGDSFITTVGFLLGIGISVMTIVSGVMVISGSGSE